MKGFTLIELMVTIAIFLITVTAVIPIGFRLFSVQNLDNVTADIMVYLRQAQTQARYQKNDSSFGVYFSNNSLVLFQGDSYATRITQQDNSVSIPGSITVSGVTQIVFNKGTGNPSWTGTIVIQQQNNSRSIQINQQGLIEIL